MDKKYRVGVASLVHDHIWSLARVFNDHPRCELVAVGEQVDELRERFVKQYPNAVPYSDWGKMFEECKMDIVLVTSENSRTADIAEVAAAHGVNILIEKPMSATLEQANRIMAAVEKNGVQLMVNWATNWGANYQTALRLLKEGAIGQVYDVRVRMAHHGPKEIGCDPYFWKWLYDEKLNGAGAYMDYCCYGAALIRLILGMPKAVMGWRQRLVKDYLETDDNGMVIAFFDNAVARTEGSWCEIPAYHDMVVLGSKGTLITSSGKLLMSTEPRKAPAEVELDERKEWNVNAAAHFVHCLDTGTEATGMCNPVISRDAQEILEAGLISDREGRRIALPLA